MARLAAWAAVIVGACLLLAPGASRLFAQPAPDRPVLLVDIKGHIGVVSFEQLKKALQRAAAEGAPALIVRINTPGGLLRSTGDMVEEILASPVPVVMYVAPEGGH